MNKDWETLLPRIARVMYNTKMSEEWEGMPPKEWEGVTYGEEERALWLLIAATGINEMKTIMKEWKMDDNHLKTITEEWKEDWKKELKNGIEAEKELKKLNLLAKELRRQFTLEATNLGWDEFIETANEARRTFVKLEIKLEEGI